MTTMTTLTMSQIQTIRLINERPGMSQVAVGADYATHLQDAGMIRIKRGKCYPTTAAAAYGTRSIGERRDSELHAHAALMGRWAAMR